MILAIRPPCMSHLDGVLIHWLTLQPNSGASIAIDLKRKKKASGDEACTVYHFHLQIIVSFFLWLVSSVTVFFSLLFGCHMAFRAQYGRTLNMPFMEPLWMYPPIRMWTIILKGMEMEGNPVRDMWVRFKVGGVLATLGPADLLLAPECVTPLCLIHT